MGIKFRHNVRGRLMPYIQYSGGLTHVFSEIFQTFLKFGRFSGTPKTHVFNDFSDFMKGMQSITYVARIYVFHVMYPLGT